MWRTPGAGGWRVGASTAALRSPSASSPGDPAEEVNADFWKQRLQRALRGRADLLGSPDTTALRLAHAESDGLPGLIVDRYGEFLVVQFLTLGIGRWKDMLVSLLVDLFSPRASTSRSDVDVREKEGLSPRTGPLWGEPPPPLVEIRENGLRFRVDVRTGQKTGFYLDQRENRARLGSFSPGAEVLDAFCYTGALGVYAAWHGAARVTFVDSSGPALELARENLSLNGLSPDGHEFVEGDVARVLRAFRAAGRRFDLIVLDPPKFAPSAQDVPRAARAYKDINLQAFHLLRPGGFSFPPPAPARFPPTSSRKSSSVPHWTQAGMCRLSGICTRGATTPFR